MTVLNRRQLLQSTALLGLGALGASGCGAGAGAAYVEPVALAVGGWLSDVAAAVAATVIAGRWTADHKPEYTPQAAPVWAHRVNDALNVCAVPAYRVTIYAVAPAHMYGVVHPGCCLVATASGLMTHDRYTDRVLIATPTDQVLLEWWAMQGIMALLKQTDRKGIDKTARLREKRLLLLTVLPVGKARRDGAANGRTLGQYYKAADGTTVEFNYSMDARGSEKVTVHAPGFLWADGDPVWDVPLTRKLGPRVSNG